MNRRNGAAPRAVILAAGKGTRLRPLTDRLPKAMAPLLGRPLLAYTIDLLRAHGVREIAINLHTHAHVIAERFGDGRTHGVEITYSFEPHLLGTAGAVKRLEDFLSGGPFFVLYGDVLTRLDLSALMDHHLGTGALATVALHQPDDPARCGIVQIDRAGWVTTFAEKPANGAPANAWANAGVYALDPATLAHIPTGETLDFGLDVFPALAQHERTIAGFVTDAPVWDIGAPDRLRQAEEWLRRSSGLLHRRDAVTSVVDRYLSTMRQVVADLDRDAVSRAARMILDARERGARVYVAGNGGSAATASHMCSDLTRAAFESPGPPLACVCLTDNVPAFSAWSNDVSFESSFERQIEAVLEPGDLVILISASGRSPNILAAARIATERGAYVLGLAGFGGGDLARIADEAVVVGSDSYGPVEDVHLLLNHLMAEVIRHVAGGPDEPAPERDPWRVPEHMTASAAAMGGGAC